MPRLFTGLEIPAEIGQTLSNLRGGLPGARWIDPEDYHVTLRFIGDIDGIAANEIASMLFRVNRKPFEVALQGLSSFGGRKPRAVVASVVPSRPLIELQAELERLMQRIGLDPEGRKFTPHVTLARLRGASNQDVGDYLSVGGYFPKRVFTTSPFVLFSSPASTGGGRRGVRGPRAAACELYAAAQARPAWPAVCRQGRGAATRPLHSWRGRARQDHADGSVFSAQFGRAQAPRALPRIHGRRSRADLRLSSEYRARRNRRRRRDRAHRGVDLRRGVAFVFRRVPCHRHRGCDDPGAAVLKTVRTRHRGGGDIQCRARRSLQVGTEPGAVPALHRADS